MRHHHKIERARDDVRTLIEQLLARTRRLASERDIEIAGRLLDWQRRLAEIGGAP